MPKGHVKVSFTIPLQMREELDYIATKMGVSRSALLTSIASDPISDLANLMSLVPDNPTEDQTLRLRGSSIDLIEERVESLRRSADDLFTKK